MLRGICVVAICANTIMFCANIIMGNKDWAMLNILSAIACWIPLLNVSGEDKDEQ